MYAKGKCHNSLITSIIAAVLFFLILGVFGKSQAAGLLKPVNGNDSLIAIKSHDVKVVINNGFARTQVDQVFVNNGGTELEAVYTFPLPEQASLSELSLWINGQEVVGEVLEKKKARELYEDQKSKGNDTAVAEKDDYKSFQISVYPVKVDTPTRVRLVYYQPLSIDLNIGRYVYPLAEGGVDDERIAFWSVDNEIKETFSFDLILKSTQPINDVRLPAHPQALIEQVTAEHAEENGNGYMYRAHFDNQEGSRLDTDILFYYRLDETVPARVELVPFKTAESKDGTFMLTITPGASLARISEGVDWVFVLDRSGSMQGNKMSMLADGVSRVIGDMSANDRFRVVLFNDTALDLTNGFLPATPEAVKKTIEQVKQIQAERGTSLYAGLERGLKKMDSERTTAIVLVTDGVANVGPQKHVDFLTLLNARDIRLFTFLMGNSGNRPLLETLARESGGFALDVSYSDDIYGRILQAKSKVLYEALHNVKVKFSGGEIDNLTPVYRQTLYQGQQLVMFGTYAKPGPVSVSLSAKISGTPHEWTCDAVLPDDETVNPEIERLWALSAIEDVMTDIRLNGETDKLRNTIVDLGENYSLVTDYTSMVVLDEQEMEGIGMQRRNADRTNRERTAQQQRQAAPAKNYRVDNTPDGGMFKGAHSSNIGSGPVGPWFLLIALAAGFIVRRKRNTSA